MKIVIDMQGAQTESRYRGLGPYTIPLVKAIIANRWEHEVILVLNGLFPDTIEPIRTTFNGLLPQENILVWYAPGPVYGSESGNEFRQQTAEMLRESFIANLFPDVVYLSSLFEGYTNCGVTSIGKFVSGLVTVVAVLDLPDNNHDVDYTSRIYHSRKLEYLKRANYYHMLPTDKPGKNMHDQCIAEDKVIICQATFQSDSATEIFDSEAKSLLNHFITIKKRSNSQEDSQLKILQGRRPKLAYVSPLPPERSGISDYSAELLPQLARYYEIEVIIDQDSVSDLWINANCPIRSVDWFRSNSHLFERVLYHFGNSHFHSHMFSLLALVPGVVVLHDFFLADLIAFRDFKGIAPVSWAEALYFSHGYEAIRQRYQTLNLNALVATYPCNLSVLQNSQGIIVHSETSKSLANKWYGEQADIDWAIIPLLRVPAKTTDKYSVRDKLKLSHDDFVVCCFGVLGPIKLNDQLIEAWLASNLSADPLCILVFVGENPEGEYSEQLVKNIRESGIGDRIRITGWTDTATFRDYLTTADAAVQLRRHSRGETSAAVLDCMNHGLPTIVNCHGSMSDLPADAVWMLPDEFEKHHLVEALQVLKQDSARCAAIGARSREIILTKHAPEICAAQYAEAIERFHIHAQSGTHAIIKAISTLNSPQGLKSLAQSISQDFPHRIRPRQLFIDVSAICRDDLKTGIQRVVRSLISELVSSVKDYRIEPIFLDNKGEKWQYFFAKKWTLKLFGITDEDSIDEIVEFHSNDILLVADFTGFYAIEGGRSGIFTFLREIGVKINFILYDLLPVKMPMAFPENQFGFSDWLELISRIADCVICISNAVSDEYREWIGHFGSQRLRPLRIEWFHLGADVANSVPTKGTPEDANQVLSKLLLHPSFLLVGTIEPRKGYLQTLDMFSKLWADGLDVNLVIVGNEGWKGLPDNERRTIPEIVDKLSNHPERGNRLFWLKGVSDEYLEKIYAACTCLIAASEGEGFGLPLIEAAQHKLPIIARDIPVFREVAREHAFYFHGLDPSEFAKQLNYWLLLFKEGRHPKSDNMPWMTWSESADQLMNAILSADNN